MITSVPVYRHIQQYSEVFKNTNVRTSHKVRCNEADNEETVLKETWTRGIVAFYHVQTLP